MPQTAPHGAWRSPLGADALARGTRRLSQPRRVAGRLYDKVVPPAQAEAMAAALARRGLPHALVVFEGEAHGFRRAEHIRAALEGELFFYGRILGFETHVRSGVAILGAGATRRGEV